MSLIPRCKYRGDIIYLQLLYHTVLLISQTKQVQNNPHGHPNCSVDGPQIWGGIRRQGENNCAINSFGLLCSQVYCSDILDAITKDFFARKGGAMDETTHVTDIQVQANFYSEKFSTLFCPRWQRSRTGLGMREPAPPCGSRERSTAPPSYRKPGRITR